MTLKEIAKEAGVSISTVSRVINGNGAKAAGKEVQERIWEIVRRSDYIPNAAAKSLKTGAPLPCGSRTVSKQLACIFARVESRNATDPFFSRLADSIEREAFQLGYLLKHSFSSFDLNDPATYRLLEANNVSGAVILGRCDKATVKFLRKNFNHVIYVALNPFDAKYDQVICDAKAAGAYVTTYLEELGHRQIAYVGETVNENRYQGYLSALQFPFCRDYVVNAPLSMDGGYRGADELLRRKTDVSAVFFGNDSMAVGALRRFKEAGVRIPEDLSIISIDDIDMAQYVTPMLTTLHIPTEEMGRTAAKILIDRIEGGHMLPMRIDLPFRLVKRESCRKFGIGRR